MYPINLDQDGVLLVIPQRAPFVFLNKVEITSPTQCIGHLTFEKDWPIFAGHFPSQPVVPGVILAEFAGQAATTLIAVHPDLKGYFGMFREINIKLRKSVFPEQSIFVEIEIAEMNKRRPPLVLGKFVGTIFRQDGDKKTLIANVSADFTATPPDQADKH